jgi:hypothetical protein
MVNEAIECVDASAEDGVQDGASEAHFTELVDAMCLITPLLHGVASD